MIEFAPLQLLEATFIASPPPIPYGFGDFGSYLNLLHECCEIGVEKALRIHNTVFVLLSVQDTRGQMMALTGLQQTRCS